MEQDYNRHELLVPRRIFFMKYQMENLFESLVTYRFSELSLALASGLFRVVLAFDITGVSNVPH
jgi:hypothetical protein